MTYAQARERLQLLLKSDRPKVLMLLGDWGTGKTRQWMDAIRSAQPAQSHAYVSAFGLSSTSDLRRRIAEECVLALKLPEGGKVGDTVASLGGKLRVTQVLRLLPVLPYLSRLDALASELAFAAVQEKVICIDDIERAPASLPTAEILGIANYLKEERNCRVVLISNREKLKDAGQSELGLYLEKVVDEWVELAPTVEEAAHIAFPSSPSKGQESLQRRVQALRVTNIRVIKQLVRMTDEIEPLVAHLHAHVLEEAIAALALFGVSHLCARADVPPFNYLIELQQGIPRRHLKRGGNGDQKSPEEATEELWEETLHQYGYSHTSDLDREIGWSVRRGFIDRVALVREGERLAQQVGATERREVHEGILHQLFDTIDEDGATLLRELDVATRAAIHDISPGSVQLACNLFVECGQSEVAERLAREFIAANQDRPEIFERTREAYWSRLEGPFAEAMQQEVAKRVTVPSIQEALDRIRPQEGWHPDDVRLVAAATTGQIEDVLRATRGNAFRRRALTLLDLDRIANGDPDAKRVADETKALLQRWSGESPIAAARLRHYIAKRPRTDAN